MNAIEMLKSQHREVDKLFAQIDKATKFGDREMLFTQVADKISIHTAIEEHHFYPAIKARQTDDVLLESLEEHQAIKRALSDLLDINVTDPSFDAKFNVLKERVQNHVR